ncbi:MAG: bifunctional UDP-N-acetylglucosamine diphosphorylase/glucosamine-1-phosphate N-acetyltransferase GlmU [Candidatus Limnocylindrales bacterium]
MSLPPDQRTVAVILAAGLGTRMRSRTPKVLHTICGRPMLAYVIEAAHRATGVKPMVVYSPATAALCDAFAEAATFALQPEPQGTARALAVGVEALPDTVHEVVVLSGDVPLVDPELVAELAEARREAGAVMALVSVDTLEPEGLGRVVRDDEDRVLRIVEEKDATESERAIDEINAGVYAFDMAWLRNRLSDVEPSPMTGEYYLPALVEMARADGHPVVALQVDDDGTLQGINDRHQLALVEADMVMQILTRHRLAGVSIPWSEATVIDADVELAEDVTIEPGVVLRGASKIGRDTVIGAASRIEDSIIGERCVIYTSVIESSVVEDDVRIGPFAHLRPGSHIGKGAEIGNFAEVKKSRLGPGTKQHHFSYIGDADVGARVNIGAGTITANYDGTMKYPTVIGDDAFIGSDTILRAPVTVGEGSVTGAGSVVTKDVPPGMLAVGVPARIRERRPKHPGAEPEATSD